MMKSVFFCGLQERNHENHSRGDDAQHAGPHADIEQISDAGGQVRDLLRGDALSQDLRIVFRVLGCKDGKLCVEGCFVAKLEGKFAQSLEFRIVVKIVVIEGEHQIFVAKNAQSVLFVGGVDLIAAFKFANYILALLYIELGAQIHVIEQDGNDQHKGSDQNTGEGGRVDKITVNGQASTKDHDVVVDHGGALFGVVAEVFTGLVIKVLLGEVGLRDGLFCHYYTLFVRIWGISVFIIH